MNSILTYVSILTILCVNASSDENQDGVTFHTAGNPQIGTTIQMASTRTKTTSVTHIVSYINTFKSKVSVKTHEDIESTSSKISVVQASAKTSTLVIVLSSVLSILFMVMVIIAIWKRCNCNNNKQSPQGVLGVKTNHTEPFYLNMLFRRECDQEINEIEQHHYEEIDH